MKEDFTKENQSNPETDHVCVTWCPFRVFSRRTSLLIVKGRRSGLGLHWSANTVIALKGRLYAEKGNHFRGACLHLFLPLAVEEHRQTGRRE
jgi:hypothetical protein